MLVGLETFDLRIPGCGSLKEKRHVVKTLTARIRQKFNVSVAEVDHQDLWFHARRVLHEVEKFVDRFGRTELIDSDVSLHYPED